jgi:predicted Zn-dependent protease
MRTAIILILSALLICPNVQSATEKKATEDYSPKDFDNGFQVAMEIMKELKIEEDPVKIKRVNEIGYRVAQRAAPEMPNFSFRIVKMEEPNAFALPGGHVVVTTGLLQSPTSRRRSSHGAMNMSSLSTTVQGCWS